LFAKKLLDETMLPMTEVGLAAGFSSIRRFNDAIRSTYRRTPSELRRAARGQRAGVRTSELRLKLSFRPPFDWSFMVRFLAPRATPGVEEVHAACYRRTVSIDGAHGVVEVEPVPGANHLVARLRLSSAAGLIHVTERLRRIFDLGADPEPITAHLRGDPRIALHVAAFPGLRIPGAWDGFELAVRAILGQQVSVASATTLAGRLAAAYGEPLRIDRIVDGSAGLQLVFPQPAVLARANLTNVGIPRARAAAINALADAVDSGALVLDASRGLEASVQTLSALPGIGEWTAQYVAMRALREPDAFPATDLGLRRALGDGSRLVAAADLLKAAEAWRPWRAYAAVYLWTMDGTAARKPRMGMRHSASGVRGLSPSA
jgi:AraC family transcriptional regulator of adaptative response / DNA-3-methyladenine glycosylase II